MHERIARVDTIGEDGSFSMTLVTEGEASDGDILSISGGSIPDRMPLLVSHWNDPGGTAGSITQTTKHLQDTPPSLKAIGQIELGGEGVQAEIRQDLAFMIQQGHVGAVSIRWDEVEGGKAPIRRVNLPSDHRYFVDADTEKSQRKRWGLFWPEWRALEGSIVALGADPKALIGRSMETEGEVREFWRTWANETKVTRADTSTIEMLRCMAAELIEGGHEQADLFNAVTLLPDSATIAEEFETVKIDGRLFFLPADLAEHVERLLQGQDHASEPAPDQVQDSGPADQPDLMALDVNQLRQPFDMRPLVEAFAKALEVSDVRSEEARQALMARLTGKVA